MLFHVLKNIFGMNKKGEGGVTNSNDRALTRKMYLLNFSDGLVVLFNSYRTLEV